MLDSEVHEGASARAGEDDDGQAEMPAAAKDASGEQARQYQDGGVLRDDWRPSGLVRLSDVQPEVVRWLWEGYVPLGKLTVLDGDPGLGKSAVTLDLGARVSAGAAMPDGTQGDLVGAAGVVLLSAEDGIADTIRPRLDAAGGDTARVAALESVKTTGGESPPTLANIDAIKDAIVAYDARLVVVDPLMAFLGGDINSYVDHDMRRALHPLVRLAERMGVAIVLVRHLTKMAGGNPLYRGGGSIGIIGVARSGLLIAPDPDDGDGERRVLAVTKSNLSTPAASLAYRLEASPNGAVRVVWEGEVEHTAASLLAAQAVPTRRTKVEKGVEVLRALLANGPRLSKDVEAEAKSVGISGGTFERARKKLGIKPSKLGNGASARWMMELPDVPTPMAMPLDGGAAGTPKSAKPAEGRHSEHDGVVDEPWRPWANHDLAPDCPACGNECDGTCGDASKDDPAQCARCGQTFGCGLDCGCSLDAMTWDEDIAERDAALATTVGGRRTE